MRKINSKAANNVRNRAKAKSKTYEGALFSVDSRVYKAFKKACDTEGLKRSSVIEEFMRYYAETS